MATRKRKSVKDLAKRRHVRTAQWRLPTGSVDVAALVASRAQMETVRAGMIVAGEVEADPALKAEWSLRADQAQANVDDLTAKIEAASDAVLLSEIPHHVQVACRVAAGGATAPEWCHCAHLAAATWTDRHGVEHQTSDYAGDLDDWLDLCESLPSGDLARLSEALSQCLGR